MRYGQFEPALIPLFGQQVRLRVDPADLTRVGVFTVDRRFVCKAPADVRLPHAAKDEQSLRAAIGRQRNLRRDRKRYFQTYDQQGRTTTDHLYAIAAEQRREQAAAAAPPNLRIVQTENDPELAKLAAALERPAGPTPAPVGSPLDLLDAARWRDPPAAPPEPDPFDLLRQRFGYERREQDEPGGEPEPTNGLGTFAELLRGKREAAG